MAQSNAGEGLDKLIAKLANRTPQRTSGGRPAGRPVGGEWGPEEYRAQRDLDFKNAVNGFVDMLARHGEVKARPDLERSVEENNARRVGGRAVAPAVKGPLSREVPGVAGRGQPGAGKGAEGGVSETIQKLIQHLEDKLTGAPTTPKYHSDNPSPENIRRYHQDSQSLEAKKLGKPGKPLNRGLF